MTARDWGLIALGALTAGSVALWLGRRRLRRSALRAVHRFRTRLARYKLQERRLAKASLQQDPIVVAAVAEHARAHHMPEPVVWRRVHTYIDEIVPHFNILTYYKLGYNLAKLFVNLLYKVSMDYQD